MTCPSLQKQAEMSETSDSLNERECTDSVGAETDAGASDSALASLYATLLRAPRSAHSAQPVVEQVVHYDDDPRRFSHESHDTVIDDGLTLPEENQEIEYSWPGLLTLLTGRIMHLKQCRTADRRLGLLEKVVSGFRIAMSAGGFSQGIHFRAGNKALRMSHFKVLSALSLLVLDVKSISQMAAVYESSNMIDEDCSSLLVDLYSFVNIADANNVAVQRIHTIERSHNIAMFAIKSIHESLAFAFNDCFMKISHLSLATLDPESSIQNISHCCRDVLASINIFLTLANNMQPNSIIEADFHFRQTAMQSAITELILAMRAAAKGYPDGSLMTKLHHSAFSVERSLSALFSSVQQIEGFQLDTAQPNANSSVHLESPASVTVKKSPSYRRAHTHLMTINTNVELASPVTTGETKVNGSISALIPLYNPANSPIHDVIECVFGFDYAPQDIVFAEDGSIIRATIHALVEELTAHDRCDIQLMSQFLLTYRSFTTSVELFYLLEARYMISPPDVLTESQLLVWQAKKQRPVRLRY